MNKNEENRIKNAFNSRPVNIDKKDLWGRVEAELPKDKRRRPFAIWWLFAAAGLMVTAAGYWYYNNASVQNVDHLQLATHKKKDLQQTNVTNLSRVDNQVNSESTPKDRPTAQTVRLNASLEASKTDVVASNALNEAPNDIPPISKLPDRFHLLDAKSSFQLAQKGAWIPHISTVLPGVATKRLLLPDEQATLDLLTVFKEQQEGLWQMHSSFWAAMAVSEWSTMDKAFEGYLSNWVDNQVFLFAGGAELSLIREWSGGFYTGIGLSYSEQIQRLELEFTQISGLNTEPIPEEIFIRSVGDTVFSGNVDQYDVRSFQGQYHQRTKDVLLSLHSGYSLAAKRWRFKVGLTAYKGVWRHNDWVLPNAEMDGWAPFSSESMDVYLRQKAGWQAQLASSVAYQLTSHLSVEISPFYRRDLQGQFGEKSKIQMKSHLFGVRFGTNYQW